MGNTCCVLPHFPFLECHKNQDLAGKFGWLLAWFQHDMMNLEIMDAIGTLCDPFHAYRKGFGTPLQPVWNAIAIGMLYDLSHTSRKDLEHLCILCGQYLPSSTSFSMMRKAQN